MAEETIWSGQSSQWKNFNKFLSAAIVACLVVGAFFFAGVFLPVAIIAFAPLVLLALVIPAVMALKPYLETRSRSYHLTTERIKTSRGIFSKVTDTLELYRVKDIETRQPFVYRMVGLENVQMNTSDASSPFVLIDAIPSKVALGDKIRNQVEIIRQQKRVRELDIE